LIPRMGVGVGEAVCAPTAASWIGDLVPPQRRARALALFMLGFPIGGALSFFFAGAISDRWGWRVSMGAAAAHKLPAKSIRESSMWAILKIPTMWWIIFSGALLHFNLYTIATFLPAMLSRVHHLSVREAGIGTGITYL